MERLHRTLMDEHFRVMGRKMWYESVEEMRGDLDTYLLHYNTERPHQGRGMNGMTTLKAFLKGLPSDTQPAEMEVKQAA